MIVTYNYSEITGQKLLLSEFTFLGAITKIKIIFTFCYKINELIVYILIMQQLKEKKKICYSYS